MYSEDDMRINKIHSKLYKPKKQSLVQNTGRLNPVPICLHKTAYTTLFLSPSHRLLFLAPDLSLQSNNWPDDHRPREQSEK